LRRRFHRLLRSAFALAALATIPSAPAAAQRIELGARGEPELDRLIRDIGAREYTLIRENRLVPRGDTLYGTIVVVDATLRLEGTIAGDLVGIDANLFLRPSGVVTGDVINLLGGFYPSELAAVHGERINEPNAPYRLSITDEVIRFDGTDARPRLERAGLRGLLAPSYDRVDGVSLGVGAALVLPYLGRGDPRLRGHLAYRSQRGVLTGGLELAAEVADLQFAAGAERRTLTNEAWIRPRWSNSLEYLFLGLDYFDHYEADRVYAEATAATHARNVELTGTLRGQIEQARTLEAGNPWSLLRRDRVRPNREIDDGRILSAIAGARADYDGRTVVVNGGVDVEAGNYTDDAGSPAQRFVRIEAGTHITIAALANHSLSVEARAASPLGGARVLPRQRWTMVGGDRTLYTQPIGAFHGDRLAWIHTTYAIPFPEAARLPILGPPTFELIHVAAMAWTADESRDLEQNIGVRLRAGFAYVRLVIDPATDGRRRVAAGFMAPVRSLPWQRGTD
jgi:hypothetical protein